MKSSEAIDYLRELPGVGPWTAGLVLLRGLGRMDVFPSGDAGAARAIRSLMPVDEGTAVEDAVASFGARKGYVYFCCLGARLLDKGLIERAPSAPAMGISRSRPSPQTEDVGSPAPRASQRRSPSE
jgi:DNA-3-methyladenine glycosylase II